MINEKRVLKVTAPLVNVRSEDNFHSDIVGEVKQGDSFDVVEPYNPKSEFVKFKYKNEERYIASAYVSVIMPRAIKKDEQHTK